MTFFADDTSPRLRAMDDLRRRSEEVLERAAGLRRRSEQLIARRQLLLATPIRPPAPAGEAGARGMDTRSPHSTPSGKAEAPSGRSPTRRRT